jgi:DNA-binding beta-propeller fold protein YncE
MLVAGTQAPVYAISQFADGSVWATQLDIQNPCPRRQVADLPLPSGTQAAGLAAIDDSRAIVSDFTGDQVFIVDFANNFINPIPVGDGPRGVAVDAFNHQRAYVVNMEDNSLSLIDLNDFLVQTITSVGLMPTEIALLPGGNQAVILSTSDQSVVLIGLTF